MTANTVLLEKKVWVPHVNMNQKKHKISDSHGEILYKMVLLDCYRDQGRYLREFPSLKFLYIVLSEKKIIDWAEPTDLRYCELLK